MQTQTSKTTVTFAHPFQLEGLDAVPPAGAYSVESENDVLDGMFFPDCLRTSVLIHLHATRDRSPGTVALPEPGLKEMLLDRTIRLLMRSDSVRTSAFVTSS